MRPLTPRKATVLSVGLSLTLIAVIGLTLDQMLKYGTGFFQSVERTAQPRVAEGRFSIGALLFLISASDVPAALRQYKGLRVQLQCWTLWLFLGAGVFYAEYYGFAVWGDGLFVLSATALGIYSLVALFRPHDLLTY